MRSFLVGSVRARGGGSGEMGGRGGKMLRGGGGRGGLRGAFCWRLRDCERKKGGKALRSGCGVEY